MYRYTGLDNENIGCQIEDNQQKVNANSTLSYSEVQLVLNITIKVKQKARCSVIVMCLLEEFIMWYTSINYL